MQRFIPAGAGNTHSSGYSYDCLDGSSPQARGTQGFYPIRHSCQRFIPAGAGNTRPRRPVDPPRAGSSPQARGTLNCGIFDSTCCSVHPRRRGEHPIPSGKFVMTIGSSPQARGTRRICKRLAVRYTVIPAGAGNTNSGPPSPDLTSVHPRRRGEHMGLADTTRFTRRFIPAGAGNTPSSYSLVSS